MTSFDSTTDSLYSRIGGKAAIDAAVDVFYDKVLADDLLRPYFDAVDVRALRAKQRIFLAYVFGGPVQYDGRDMRDAHAGLVERGLSEPHFQAVGGHLASTLTELGVPADVVDEVMAIVASTHDDVLGL